jgi:hypothetical protein
LYENTQQKMASFFTRTLLWKSVTVKATESGRWKHVK